MTDVSTDARPDPAGGTAGSAAEPTGPFWTIWLAALLIVAGLVAAVTRYLSLPSSPHHQHGGATDAVLRLGGSGPRGQLLGRGLLTNWQLDSVAVVFVVLVGAGYFAGVRRARRSGGWPVGRSVAFTAGLATCLLATCGSIGVYDQALYSAHMLGHLAFVMVAPALLMAGRPLELSVQATSGRAHERLRRVLSGRVVTLLTAPPVALASYAVVIVGSHLTGLMDVIMRNSWAGQLEHLAYLLIGCQFFVLVLGDAPIHWRLSTPARWLLLAISMAVDTFVGIVIMQGNQAVSMVPVRGLQVDQLSDTHTGGSIMWFGGDGIMAAVMILLVIGWLRDPARQRMDNSGWLEQARRATFAAHVGPSGSGEDSDASADLDFDEKDERLRAYNEWLARLQAHDKGR